MILKTIKYDLLNNFKGVQNVRDSIFCDLKTDVVLSFCLSQKHKEKLGLRYVVEFSNEELKENFELVDMQIQLPKYLFRQGILMIRVLAVDENNEIVFVWNCEPMLINNFNEKAKSAFEFMPDVYTLMQRYKECVNEVANYKDILDDYKNQIDELIKSNNETLTNCDNIINEYKIALEKATNDFEEALSKYEAFENRLKQLEENYDPALI